MPGLKPKKPRFTVVGRERARRAPVVAREIEGVGVDAVTAEDARTDTGKAIEKGVARTLVPIEDAPAQQIKLLETDDEAEADRFIREYRGELVGLHKIDSRQNRRGV